MGWKEDDIAAAGLSRELEEMGKVTKEEYLASLQRMRSGFARGVSNYRGVARHHHNRAGKPRIGRLFGNKYLYLQYSRRGGCSIQFDCYRVSGIEYFYELRSESLH